MSRNAVRGITSAVQAANPGASVTFDACGTSTTAKTAANCSAQTQNDIKSADLVIVFVATDSSIASEGLDRKTIAMPGNYDSLISEVHSLGNPRTAPVIQGDAPVTIDDVQGDFAAIVFSGYNGQSQGAALADVLTGKQDPSGSIYAANVPLQPGKTVAYLTLPNISDGVASGQNAMHIFAVSAG